MMDFIDYDTEDRVLLSAGNPVDTGLDDEEEDVQDWSKLQNFTKKSKIKKKLNKSGIKSGNSGEKEFQPLNNKQYDMTNLENLRSVMYETLGAKRGVQSSVEQINQTTIFYNSFLNKCYMYSPKGTFLKSMGRTDKFKRCWLESEEAIYLIERGTCVVKDDSGVIVSEDNLEIEEEHQGFELSLEEIYSLLIKNDDEYDNYCVYANLKRLGYIVIRSNNQEVESAEETDDIEEQNGLIQSSFQMTFEDYSHLRQSISQNLSILLLNNFKNVIFRPLIPLFGFIKRILVKHQILSSSIFNNNHFHHTFYRSYSTIFEKLRVITSNHNIPITREQHLSQQYHHNVDPNSAYSSFTFDVWKPTPNFSKKTPPLPDYQICVVNINKSKFPSLEEIKLLMNKADHKSNIFKNDKNTKKQKFHDLKNGYRNCLIAVVDHGVINYINLKEFDFVEEGVVYKLQLKKKQKGKGKWSTITENVLTYFNWIKE